MSNFISWGLGWFNQMRTGYLTEPVTVVHKSGSANLQATVIEPDTALNPQGISVKTDKYRFVFTYSDIQSIVFTRGTKIIRNNYQGQIYEVVTDKDTPEYFNDPNNQELVIPAKKCS